MIPKTLLMPSWEEHVKALATIGHNAVGSMKRPLRVFLVNMDEGVEAWRELFPLDLLFVYSTNKAIEGASVIHPKETFPFVDGTFDLVVYQDENDQVLEKLFSEQLLRLVHEGGYGVIYKDIEAVKESFTNLFEALPQGSRLNRVDSIPAFNGEKSPMVLVVRGAMKV